MTQPYLTEIDEFGVEYDITNHRLICVEYDCHFINKTYYVREGTRVILDAAFRDVNSLEKIIIPDSVLEIREYAFLDCKNLKHIQFSNSLLTIEDWAFSGCVNLSNVVIPSEVNYFGNGVFRNCSNIDAFEIDPRNEKYLFDSGIIYSIDKSFIVSALSNFISNEIKIPEGVIRINDYAFYQMVNLSAVLLPNSIESLGNNCFEKCNNLREINFPNNLKSIGKECFQNTSINIVNLKAQINKIGYCAFAACEHLTEIQVDQENKHFTSIDGVLFSTNRTFNLLNYPAGASRVEYTVPNAVWSIDRGSFKGCTSLQKVNLPNQLSELEIEVFEDCTELIEVKLPTKLKFIKSSTFKGCTSLSTIFLPESLVCIEYLAFCGCSSLKDIFITKQLTKIGGRAFYECENIRFEVDPNNPVFKSINNELHQRSPEITEVQKFENEYNNFDPFLN